MAPTPVDMQPPGVPNFLDEFLYFLFGGGFGLRQSANAFLLVGAVVILFRIVIEFWEAEESQEALPLYGNFSWWGQDAKVDIYWCPTPVSPNTCPSPSLKILSRTSHAHPALLPQDKVPAFGRRFRSLSASGVLLAEGVGLGVTLPTADVRRRSKSESQLADLSQLCVAAKRAPSPREAMPLRKVLALYRPMLSPVSESQSFETET